MAGLSRLPMRVRSGARVAAALAMVAGTIAVVGTEPFAAGLASISPPTIFAAAVLAAVATAAAAWRWRVVCAGFGLSLPWAEAFTAYYRSQFLNTVLPGGVAGDVHRAYVHGRRIDGVGLAARAVVAERVAGQVVQLVLTLALLLPLGITSPLAPLALATAVAAGVVAVALAAVVARRRGRELLRRELRMLRPLLATPLRLVAIVAASVVVIAAHTGTFVVAGLAVGVTAAPQDLAVVALLVLAAAAIPLNAGGWGPREAVAASAFALAGLGAGAGLAVSAAFGVLTALAVAPGALTLLGGRFRSPAPRGIIGKRRTA
ncbi:lysylphosphatidylglycerol synthase domain-containing protein [Microbacterium hibisci]|uniref:lysylphosphatidylglycerol synthase domain-containing protein n=1 Tax=Microbacterium hibisci TaxID=2036000 RepID=UPI001943A4A6|nr:lysylphosphatidylglycerol synthase domain-containing protein [Microbacterium hibisci]